MNESKHSANNPKTLAEGLVADAHEIYYGEGFMTLPSFTGGRRTRVTEPVKIRAYPKGW